MAGWLPRSCWHYESLSDAALSYQAILNEKSLKKKIKLEVSYKFRSVARCYVLDYPLSLFLSKHFSENFLREAAICRTYSERFLSLEDWSKQLTVFMELSLNLAFLQPKEYIRMFCGEGGYGPGEAGRLRSLWPHSSSRHTSPCGLQPGPQFRGIRGSGEVFEKCLSKLTARLGC